MIYFILGIILGVLIRDIKYSVVSKIDEVKKHYENTGSAQFFDPITKEEKWKKARSVEDLLDK